MKNQWRTRGRRQSIERMNESGCFTLPETMIWLWPCSPVFVYVRWQFRRRSGSELQSQPLQATCWADAKTFCFFKDSSLQAKISYHLTHPITTLSVSKDEFSHFPAPWSLFSQSSFFSLHISIFNLCPSHFLTSYVYFLYVAVFLINYSTVYSWKTSIEAAADRTYSTKSIENPKSNILSEDLLSTRLPKQDIYRQNMWWIPFKKVICSCIENY